MEKIRVRPHKEVRKEFARWAMPNKVRTVSPHEFLVPVNLFSKIPEQLLIGSTINSLPYVTKNAASVSGATGVKHTKPFIIESEKEQIVKLENVNDSSEQPPTQVSEETTSSIESEQKSDEQAVEAPQEEISEEETEKQDDSNVDVESLFKIVENSSTVDNLTCTDCAEKFEDERGLSIHRRFKHSN